MLPSTKKKLGLTALAFALLLVLAGDKVAVSFSPRAQERAAQQRVDRGTTGPLTSLPHPGDFVMGDPKAPVALVEYASLTCSHCAHFHADVLPSLKKNYIDTGKVFYILRQFPLNEPAMKAAQVVTCIGDKEGAERYYAFNRALFNAQRQWAFQQDFLAALKPTLLVGGVDGATVDACAADKMIEARILASIKDAADVLKVNRTPTVFVNGKQPESPTLPLISALVDAALAH